MNGLLRWLLIVTELIIGISALIGGIGLIITNGLSIPLSYLEGTVFSSFVLPGVILSVVVGGTQLSAAIFTTLNDQRGLELSAIAGFGILIWIYVELVMIFHVLWLMHLYFALGVIELTCVLILLRTAQKRG